MPSSEPEHRAFLLSCATWQDTLLQSYRTLHVTIQGFLIAAGAAVLAVQLTSAIQDQSNPLIRSAIFNSLYTLLLGFLFWLQKLTSAELKGVVESRSQDIDYWHKQLILAENSLPTEQRVFTYFKMWQQAKRASVDHLLQDFLPTQGISESLATQLIGKGISHTRRVLDVNLFKRLQMLWVAILLASSGITVWSLHQCMPQGGA